MRRRQRRRTVRRALDVLACLLVMVALLAPNQLGRITPGAFARIPLEGLVGVLFVLGLPARVQRPVAAVGGGLLGVLTVGKLLDMGFFSALSRPFDPLNDWVLFGNAAEFVSASAGRAGAIAAVAAAVALGVAVVVLLTGSVIRSAGLAVRRSRLTNRAAGGLAIAWFVCAALGVQAAPGELVAATDTLDAAVDRVRQVRAGQQDEQEFAAALAHDAARDVPAASLLSGLRGKDVVVAFVESYGRDAVADPELAPQIGAVLADGSRRLNAAGYSSRSAFLTSPTAGGGSWLAHATFLAGVWTTNEQRYRSVIASDRTTLNGAFRRAGWRTVGVMPGITRDWPEGAFFGYDRVYDSRQLGYRGPGFGWSPVPDQFTLAAFERLERARRSRGPLMAEIPLTSSHIPWTPLPSLVDWKDLGDGSRFGPMAAAGQGSKGLLKDPARARAAYRQSLEYSLAGLISYVETYGDDDLVLVLLGDHQPSPIVTGQGASRDVPITIVAGDEAVLDPIASWGWQDGLIPGPQAPVWRMDTFRDRFLEAYSPS